MSKYCEYCSHSLEDNFNCLPCMHLEHRPYADNTVVLEDLFILSPSIVFCKGTPGCPWYDMCIYKTATCRVRYPDNGCVLYRWFKELISKETKND